MPLQKLPVVPVVPRGMDQETEESQLPLGRLRELRDMHQVSPGLYSKRNGYTPMDVVSADTGGVVLGSGRGLISSDRMLVKRTSDGVYTRSTALARWEREVTSRCVSAKPPPEVLPFGYKPSMIRHGNYLYYFCADYGQHTVVNSSFSTEPQIGDGRVIFSVASHWYYRVVDLVTGAEVTPLTEIADVVGWQAKPVISGGFVWLFVGAHDPALNSPPVAPRIYAVKMASVPAVTTYYDATVAIHGFDVIPTHTGGVAVVAYGASGMARTAGADPANCVATLLDTATGLPLASPGKVGTDIGTSPTDQMSVNFLKNEKGASGSYYVLRVGGGLSVTVDTFSASTLLRTGAAPLADYASQPLIVCGYREQSTGYFVTFSALTSAQVSKPEDALLSMHKHNSAGVTQASYQIRHRCFPVSEPFEFDGNWYVLACHDDSAGENPRAHLQQAYLLIAAPTAANPTGVILGKSIQGAGGDVGQKAAYFSHQYDVGWIAPVVVDGNEVSAALNSWNGTQYVTREVAFVFDDEADGKWGRLGPMVRPAEGQEIVIPDAWPLHVAGNAVAEYVPMYPRLAPVLAAESADTGVGLPAGWYDCCYRWMYRDPIGNVHRSRPSQRASINLPGTNNYIKFTVHTLALTNSAAGDWFIELYVTKVKPTQAEAQQQTPKLQFAAQNDPTVATLSYVLAQSTIIDGEDLETDGGGELAPDSPPPFGWAAFWRNRCFLGDTDQIGQVWVSKEKESGFGYAFSVGLTLEIHEGTGRIRAGGAVDFNYFALFKQDGIWIVSGDGPDKTGRGMYEPVRLPGNLGCANPNSLVTTPKGLIFQGTDGPGGASVSDGGIYLLTRDLRIVYLGAGVENYRGRPVSAAVYVPETQQARFFVEFEPRVAITLDGMSTPSPIDIGSVGTFVVAESYAWHIPWTELPGTRFRVRLAGRFTNVGGSVGTWQIRLGNAPTTDSFGKIGDGGSITGTTLLEVLSSATEEQRSERSAFFAKPTDIQTLKIVAKETVNLSSRLDAYLIVVELY